jgi:hypothetical protein
VNPGYGSAGAITAKKRFEDKDIESGTLKCPCMVDEQTESARLGGTTITSPKRVVSISNLT